MLSYSTDLSFFRKAPTLLESKIKLIDFGLAMQFNSNTKATTSCGSLAYAGKFLSQIVLAPEVFSRKEYSPKVDVYSMGCLLCIL
jgi:serine/threonine protein kinase